MRKATSTRSTKRVNSDVAPKVGRASEPTPPSHEEIARRAYEIYLAEGRPEGRDLEHWARAEAELLARG